MLFYLCFSIHSGMVLQQDVCHLCVAIVTGHMQRCVTHLQEEETETFKGATRGKKVEYNLYGLNTSSCYITVSFGTSFYVKVNEMQGTKGFSYTFELLYGLYGNNLLTSLSKHAISDCKYNVQAVSYFMSLLNYEHSALW